MKGRPAGPGAWDVDDCGDGNNDSTFAVANSWALVSPDAKDLAAGNPGGDRPNAVVGGFRAADGGAHSATGA